MAERSIDPPAIPQANDLESRNMGRTPAGNPVSPQLTSEENEVEASDMSKNSSGNPGSPLPAPEDNEFERRDLNKKPAESPGSLNNGKITRAPHRRGSIGSYHPGDSARRYSTVTTESAKISQDKVPHYLRASVGSCHDICKYGRQLSSEVAARTPFKRSTAKSSTNELKHSVEIMEKVVKRGSLADPRRRSLLVKPSTDAKSSSVNLRVTLDAKTCSPRQSASSSDKIRLPCSPIRRVEKRTKNGNPSDNKMSRVDKTTSNQPMKLSSSVKSKPFKAKSLSTASNSEGIHGEGRRSSDVKTGKKATASTLSARNASVCHSAPSPWSKVSLVQTASSKASKNGRQVLLSAPKDRNWRERVDTETSNKKDSEKTLHIIKTGTKDNTLECIPGDSAIPALPSSSSAKALSHAKSPSTFSHEEDEEVKCNGDEPDESVSANTISVEIVQVQPVNKNNKRTEKVGRENNELQCISDEGITGDHVILAPPSSSSPEFLSRSKSPFVLPLEEDYEEINSGVKEVDEFVSDKSVSVEIDKVQPLKDNYETLRMGTENIALESILDNHPVPALLSSSSPKSLSHEKSPSILSHGEKDREIKCNGIEADEFVSDKAIFTEIDKVQPVKDNPKTVKEGTESNALYYIPDDHAIPAPQSPLSSKSLSHAKLPSLLSHEEDDEEAKNCGIDGDNIGPGNTAPMEIGKAQSVKENKKAQRKSRVFLSEDKCRSPVKLKFRRGKVLNLQPDNNTCRRLRFRRAGVNGKKAADGFVSEEKKPVEVGDEQPVKERDNKTLRKSRPIVSEDMHRSPVKKLFRIQKAVDLQLDNNNPKRLKFRTARVLGPEDGKGNLRRRISRKAGGRDDATGAELSSLKVHLKHQDMQEKKDAQSLFNNVIEETASKLVKSRKSKVKALVGAFEAVISLQELPPRTMN